jgi:hypothetical protein
MSQKLLSFDMLLSSKLTVMSRAIRLPACLGSLTAFVVRWRHSGRFFLHVPDEAIGGESSAASFGLMLLLGSVQCPGNSSLKSQQGPSSYVTA